MNYDSVHSTPSSRASFEDLGEGIHLADLPLLADAAGTKPSIDEPNLSHIENDAHLYQAPSDDQRNFRSLDTVEPGSHSQAHHEMTVMEAIRAYPMAIFWCLAVSMCVIMEGYDAILISNLFAFPSFQRKYGNFVGVTEQTQSGYQLSPAWMAAVGNASGVGAFFGTLLNGHLVTIFGQKRVLIGALILLSCFILMTFFAPTIHVLLVGQILCGFPWGVFATTAPAYASEVLPMPLRVYFTSWTNMCFIIGQLLAAGVLRACLNLDGEWGFRLPFAGQWVWPSFLIPLLCCAPESPWHLVRQRRLDEAEQSLRRLQRASAKDVDIHATLASIVHTNRLEEELAVGTSYWDCFQGFELRRTEIACLCFAGQILSGSSFAYNASYFFEQVGLAAETTYTLNLGGTGLALVGTLINWFGLMPYFGRRPIYLGGMLAMAVELYLIGVLGVWATTATPRPSNAADAASRPFVALVQAALTLVWTITFQLSVGQLGWAVPAEVGSTRLRQKTICLARNAYYIAGVVAGVLQPYLMNPTALNLRGYTGFVWGSTALLTFVWAFFRLPETKDRTFEQLDLLFANRVPARRFASTNVDALELSAANADAEQLSLARKYSLGSASASEAGSELELDSLDGPRGPGLVSPRRRSRSNLGPSRSGSGPVHQMDSPS